MTDLHSRLEELYSESSGLALAKVSLATILSSGSPGHQHAVDWDLVGLLLRIRDQVPWGWGIGLSEKCVLEVLDRRLLQFVPARSRPTM